jgi:hypothetical protein
MTKNDQVNYSFNNILKELDDICKNIDNITTTTTNDQDLKIENNEIEKKTNDTKVSFLKTTNHTFSSSKNDANDEFSSDFLTRKTNSPQTKLRQTTSQSIAKTINSDSILRQQHNHIRPHSIAERSDRLEKTLTETNKNPLYIAKLNRLLNNNTNDSEAFSFQKSSNTPINGLKKSQSFLRPSTSAATTKDPSNNTNLKTIKQISDSTDFLSNLIEKSTTPSQIASNKNDFKHHTKIPLSLLTNHIGNAISILSPNSTNTTKYNVLRPKTKKTKDNLTKQLLETKLKSKLHFNIY